MSDTTPAPEDAGTAAPQAQRASNSAILLGLLVRLLDFGRTMLAELRQHDGSDAPPPFVQRFATTNLALIIARITRGIMIAQALHDRVTRGAPRLDAPDRPSPSDRPTQERRTRPERPVQPRRQPVDEAAELHNLPSAQEIADRIRHRPIGAVIEEICRDLGIDSRDELWGPIQRAVMLNGGNCWRVMQAVLARAERRHDNGLEPLPLPPWIAERVELAAWFGPEMRATPPPW